MTNKIQNKTLISAAFLFLISVLWLSTTVPNAPTSVCSGSQTKKEFVPTPAADSAVVKWGWMAGNKSANVFGEYGVKGIENSTNFPGARDNPMSWTDGDDNWWLFGGYGRAESSWGHLNDLWRFNTTSYEWTWIAGNKTPNVNNVYGVKGVANSMNFPGARHSSLSWRDADWNLWLFGGWDSSYTLLNDLWRFNITSQEWTWISGNNTVDVNGVYGTKGVPSSTKFPGSRRKSIAWKDGSGNLWLFGGTGYAESGTGYLNDLWRYNIISQQWTWMDGSKSANANGVYGTKGVPSGSNYPGSRFNMVPWTDADGNWWLFGGQGYAESGTGFLNDLWMLNTTN